MPANTLVQCINQFALQASNPVIDVLPDNGVVKFEKKYPEPMLNFSGLGLRAYYHCHTPASRQETEHGHFHIFLKTDNEQWSHLAGLSMDDMGQPFQWFTVNHWVTGETWNKAELLEQRLNNLLENTRQEIEPVENWLLAMLEFYQQSLNQLLRERDRQISASLQGNELESILKDRTIYTLSQYKINLLNDLETYANLSITTNPHP